MASNSISPWNKLYNLLKLERRDLLQVLYYAVFAGLISLTLPLGIQAIINLIQGAEVSSSWILLTALVTIGVGLMGALQVLQLDILENIQEKVFARAAFEFIYKFPKIRVRELENTFPPELSNRFFDVLTLQKGLEKLLIDFPAAVIQIVFGLFLLSFYHPFFIGLGLLLVILLYIFFKISMKKAVATSISESKQKYKVAFWIQQVAANFKTFKNTSHEYEQQRNNDLVQNYLNDRQRHFKIVKNQFKQLVGFKVIMTLGLLLIGGLLVLSQQMNIGQFVAAEIIILLIINSIDKIGFSLETIYDVVTAIEKIDEVSSKKIDKKARVSNKKNTIFPIQVEALEVDYNRANSFTIERGDVVNIIGKHLHIYELFHFLAAMKKTRNGKIYLNRKEISNINLDDYRKRIGLVLNTNYLFDGTIWQNLTLNNISLEEDVIYDFLEEFGVLEEINSLSQSVDTHVFPGTRLISHALVQKIRLIRELLKFPEFLMIEEEFILYDRDIEYLVQYAETYDCTIILASKSELKGNLRTITLNTNGDA
ncbi:ABC transporter transmembrane domain-containing protein [Mesonia aquimarina]|uniref:ABC transporter transmembrane domain-containing protein n=1 Tax=Mesonia aquimarina TaxID=1504967 RepID=UPI000EF5AF47|nr:ABC transporter ATP-binding protein [Mesonia aquimarina]